MAKITLVYPPFCTPAAPPYSITNLYAFIRDNPELEADALDLNLWFHLEKFGKYKEYYQQLGRDYDEEEYSRISLAYRQETKRLYGENSKKIIRGEKPDLFDEALAKILGKEPDVVGFSVVYSSQAFYTYSLILALKEKGIKVAVGGPAVNERLKKAADFYAKDKTELLGWILGKKIEGDDECVLDFSIHRLKDYFVPSTVLPLKTSNTCYYKQCTYCTHYDKDSYKEFSLDKIEKTVAASGARHFFLVDEMIPRKRLLELAAIFKKHRAKWTCQLRPTKELDYETLKTLRESGLAMLMWGVESGSDRILGLIRKGTNVKDVEKVLSDSHRAGIKNIAYIIFGFPTETKEEFLETIGFLKKNSESIDLVSTSVFGLQKGTPIFECPEKFGIKNIVLQERTVLEPMIGYEQQIGLTPEAASLLRKRYRRTLEKLDRYPKLMNFFREHMLCLME
ncbi:MAG: B12-binding domain-containing radical SAM protein [archaeon]